VGASTVAHWRGAAVIDLGTERTLSGSRGAYSLSRNEVAHESAAGRYPRSGA